MGAFVDPSDEIIEVSVPVNAVRKPDHVEVWCEDWELHYGNLPVDATPALIECAYRFHKHGEASGANKARAGIRLALGIV